MPREAELAGVYGEGRGPGQPGPAGYCSCCCTPPPHALPLACLRLRLPHGLCCDRCPVPTPQPHLLALTKSIYSPRRPPGTSGPAPPRFLLGRNWEAVPRLAPHRAVPSKPQEAKSGSDSPGS